MTSLEHVPPVERLRLRAGLSQAEVSLKSGVDQRTLRYAEQGEREPRLSVLLRLATFYEVDPADLLNEIRAYRQERERVA